MPPRGVERRGKDNKVRVAGHNLLAILVAALAIYGVSAVIFGWLLGDLANAASGCREYAYAGQEWREFLFPLPPLLFAIGLSVVVKWRGATDIGGGAATGFIMALFFAFAHALYPLAYDARPLLLSGMDALQLFTGLTLGGVILAVWK